MNSGFSQSFRVEPTHPALPGHFPGQPLVPGVMLLEQVALGLRAWRAQRLVRVLEAKFVAPLMPGEQATLLLAATEAHVANARFEIRRDGTLLARGVIEGTT